MKRYVKATKGRCLYAEWLDYMDAYRIFDKSDPMETLFYDDDLDMAEFHAIELGYDAVIVVDSNTYHLHD